MSTVAIAKTLLITARDNEHAVMRAHTVALDAIRELERIVEVADRLRREMSNVATTAESARIVSEYDELRRRLRS